MVNIWVLHRVAADYVGPIFEVLHGAFVETDGVLEEVNGGRRVVKAHRGIQHPVNLHKRTGTVYPEAGASVMR